MRSPMIEVRCPNCRKLLCEYEGFGTVRIKCERCGSMVRYPALHPEIIPLDDHPPTRPGPKETK